MKKVISMFLIISVVTISLLLPVNAETMTPAQSSGTMQIYTERSEEIEVSFPASVSVPWNTQGEFGIGEITAEKMVIHPNKKVTITVASQNNSKFVGESGEIPYTLGGADSIEFTDANPVYPLTVSVAQNDWDTAAAGEYSDTLTFTLSYINR